MPGTRQAARQPAARQHCPEGSIARRGSLVTILIGAAVSVTIVLSGCAPQPERFEADSIRDLAIPTQELREPATPRSSRVDHVVLVWLREPGSTEDWQRVADATRSFADLPGVLAVEIGRPLASDRPSVDDSFDLGIRMTFQDTAALEAYLVHPRHEAAVHEVLYPLVARFQVYDLLLEP